MKLCWLIYKRLFAPTANQTNTTMLLQREIVTAKRSKHDNCCTNIWLTSKMLQSICDNWKAGQAVTTHKHLVAKCFITAEGSTVKISIVQFWIILFYRLTHILYYDQNLGKQICPKDFNRLSQDLLSNCPQRTIFEDQNSPKGRCCEFLLSDVKVPIVVNH